MRVSLRAHLLAVTFALVFPSVLTLIYFVVLADRQAGWQYVSAGLGKVIQFGFPLVWVLLVLREKPSWPSSPWRGVGVGTAFGLLVAAAMLGLYHFGLKPAGLFDGPDQAIREKVAGMHLDRRWSYLAISLVYPLLHSLIEEYYWRWFVFGRLRRVTSLAPAIVISSLGFMAHHVIVLATFFGWGNPAAYLLALCVAIGGGAWAWIYEKSGSLLGAWFSHALIDAAIFLVGYDVVREILT